MKYLLDAAREYGLDGITEQAMGNPDVHGVIVDIHPFWLYCRYLNMSGLNEESLYRQFEYFRYFFRGDMHLQSLPHFFPPYSLTTTNFDVYWRPAGWNDFIGKSNLIVKILLRPGSKPVEIKYEGQLNITQEHRPVAHLSANSKSPTTPLEGGTSVGYATDSPGTLGGILEDTQNSTRYGLTCGHVITGVGYDVDHPSQIDSTNYSSIGKSVLSECPAPNGGTRCNSFNTGVLNKMDIALVKLKTSIKSNLSVLNIGNIQGATPGNQLCPNLAIEYNGRSSNYKSLVLGGIGVIQEVMDSNNQPCCISELIEVKEPSITSLVINRPVKGGDSGAWLITQGASGNEWCGMIVAEDRQTGYAIMSESILDFLAAKGFNLKCY